jgi:hypothetical protein
MRYWLHRMSLLIIETFHLNHSSCNLPYGDENHALYSQTAVFSEPKDKNTLSELRLENEYAFGGVPTTA